MEFRFGIRRNHALTCQELEHVVVVPSGFLAPGAHWPWLSDRGPAQNGGLTLIIVRRVAGSTGFVVQPRRWVVERSLGWLGRWRRLSKDYEELPEVSEAMVTLAMIRLMLHRLAHPNRRRLPAP